MPGLKIAVVFDKHPKCCQYMRLHSDVYFPLVGGRDTMNKDLNCDDIPGVRYDNEGDNISWLNPYINEITAIYWLWKHLDTLGDPDYIGLHHYRRFFLLEEYKDSLAPDTLILNHEKMMLPMVDFLELCHGTGYQFLEIANRVLKLNNPDLKKMFNDYINSLYCYTRNLFVIPKSALLTVTQYVETVLPHIVKDINYDLYGTPGARNMGFIMERLVGFYFYILVTTGQYKAKHVMFRYVDPKELETL